MRTVFQLFVFFVLVQVVWGDVRHLKVCSSWNCFWVCHPPLPAGGKYGGSVGHLLCVCCPSDDETGAESLNLCINDELSPLFISHHHILQLGKALWASLVKPGSHPPTQVCTCVHMCTLMHKHTTQSTRFRNTHVSTIRLHYKSVLPCLYVVLFVLLHFPSSCTAPFNAVTSLCSVNRSWWSNASVKVNSGENQACVRCARKDDVMDKISLSLLH